MNDTDNIRAAFKQMALESGFTIKPGLTDLKDYVYSFAELCYQKGQRDMIEAIGETTGFQVLEPSLYQNIDKPHLTWTADNFKLLNIDTKEWVPLFRLPETN